MFITGLELNWISVPFRRPYALSRRYGTLAHAQAVIVRVHTNQGLVGLGEADPMNPFTEETPATVCAIMRDHIAPVILGRDPTQIGALEMAMDDKIQGNLQARGAINMALHDLAGKAAGLPAHALLGGKIVDDLPILGPIGSGSPEDDHAGIEQWLDMGYGTIMIKMGALPIVDDIRRMVAADKAFGDRAKLIVDANQGWSVFDSLQFVHGINGHWPRLIEQPVARHDLEGMRRIGSAALCPVSADEGVMSLQDAREHLDRRAAKVFSIKVSKNGGISKARAIAQVAQAYGVKILMNSMLEFGITQAASLQLGCTLPNLMDVGHAYMSVVRMSEDVTDFAMNINGGTVKVPERPGLGVEIDEEILRRYTVESLKIT
jgi:muconate cycloisomerase